MKKNQITVDVPYRGPGSVIRYTPVSFEVEEYGGLFKAVPLRVKEDKRLTDLPTEMLFQKKSNKWVLLEKGEEQVMQAILSALNLE